MGGTFFAVNWTVSFEIDFVKRISPEDNRAGGHPKDEADTNGDPKVASNRREVWSVFFGGLAALALCIAGLFFSGNRPKAILWFWIAGVFALTSWCFFWASKERHPAIRGVWWTGFLVVSFCCLVWAWPENAPDAPKAEVKASPAPPVPSPQNLSAPSPAPTPSRPLPIAVKSTAKQIMDKIGAEYEWLRDEKRKAFEGMSVDWTLQFFVAERRQQLDGEEMSVTFISRDKDGAALVYLSVPVQGNEHLPITERDEIFRVRGIIQKIKRYGITLKRGATFEAVLEANPSATPKIRRK